MASEMSGPTLEQLRAAWAGSHPAARAYIILELRSMQLRMQQSSVLDVLRSEDRQERWSESLLGQVAGAHLHGDEVDKELANLIAVAASLLEATVE